MRTRSHNCILPNVRTSRFKSVFINRCLFNSNQYLFSRFPYVFFRFSLFIFLPCKLLHVCLRNEFLIKNFIIIIIIIIKGLDNFTTLGARTLSFFLSKQPYNIAITHICDEIK